MSVTDPTTVAISGMRIGRYEIVRPIGEGGMAQVYLCVRRGAGGFEKQMVIKVLHSRFLGDKEFVSMFLEEARLLARLRHPNIVDVSEVECVDGVPYLAMEYVDGPTIGLLAKHAVKANDFRFGLVLHLIRQVCEALRATHELRIDGAPAGLVHRDVSAQNVMVDAMTGVAKLIDFGVAKATDTLQQTQAGFVKGKIHYLAPEVLSGAKPDARNDLYAVGVLLYRLIVGRLPYREADLAGGRHRAPYVPLTSVPGLPEGVSAIVMKALAADPEERYQTAADLSADLAWVIDDLHVDPQQIPQWIQQLFPESEWSSRPEVGKSSHTALTRLVHDIDERSAVRPRVVRAAALVGLGGAITALLALGLAAWVWLSPPPSSKKTDAELYLSAAADFAQKGDFARALELNGRAEALDLDDAALVIRIAQQRSELEKMEANKPF